MKFKDIWNHIVTLQSPIEDVGNKAYSDALNNNYIKNRQILA